MESRELINYAHPELAPDTALALNGLVVLKRYEVQGVIYAPDRRTADLRLLSAALVLDAARLVPAPGDGHGAAPLAGSRYSVTHVAGLDDDVTPTDDHYPLTALCAVCETRIRCAGPGRQWEHSAMTAM